MMKKFLSLSLGLILSISSYSTTNPILPNAGGTGVSNSNSDTITLGAPISTQGAVTFSGLFSFTANLSAATSITFPTSGTLITDAGSYANPPWLASLAGSKLTGTVTANAITAGTYGINITGTAAGGAPPSGSAGGDLSNTYPNPTVTKINGNTLGSTAPTNGYYLGANGSLWHATSGSALTGSNDTNITITLGGTPTTALLVPTSITMGWTGTLAAARLNSNVVQGVTNDTNITGSISAQNLTLGWSGTLAAPRINFNSTNLKNSSNALNTIQDIATTSSPTFGGQTISGTGTVTSNITSTTTGSRNEVDLITTRGDEANGYNLWKLTTGATNDWQVGEFATSNTVYFYDAANGVTQLAITQGPGTTGAVTVAGEILANSEALSNPLGAIYGGTAQSSYTLGDIIYASAANTLSKLAGNTTSTRKFLRQTGTGTISAAPAWDTITAADVPASALTASNDTNITLTLGGSPSAALLNAASITVGWTGTLAAGRLNSNVVQSVTNDTNVTGSISAQNLTLGWTGTLSAARLNFNTTDLQNSGGMLDTAQGISASASPQFAGLTLQNTGQVLPTVKSTTTGSLNEASIQLVRGDSANGYSRIKYGTGGSFDWSTGTRSGSSDYKIYDEANSVTQLDITQGSGTSSIATFAGNLVSNALKISGQNAVGTLQTDSSGNVTTVSGTTNFTPTIGDGTNNFTTSTATGKYEKIGNMYRVWVYIVWTGKGSASAGSPLTISLPAAIGASTPYAPINLGYTTGVSWSGSMLVGSGASGASTLNLYGLASTGSAATVDVSGASTSGQINFFITYTSN